MLIVINIPLLPKICMIAIPMNTATNILVKYSILTNQLLWNLLEKVLMTY